MKKRVLALILAIVTMLSLVACGKDSGGAAGGENGGEGFLMVGDDCALDNVDFSLLDKELDPQEVYDNLTYTPQMFCGEYRISYWYEDDRDQRFAETQEFEKVKIGDEQKEISKMLMAIEMGNENTMMGLDNSKDYAWARIHFVQMFNGKPYLDTKEASVEVEGNKVKFTILEEWSNDNEAKKVTYKFSDVVLEYEFEFSGRKLTLSRDGATVGMAADEVTGIKATMYDGENDGLLVFGSDGVARVGDEGDTQPLATREESPNGVAVWDETNKRFKTVTGPEGTTLTIIDGQPTFEAEGENRKGYMPLYAPYLQLPLFPEPQEIFYGEWKDVTHLYAGLFMRFAGGEATEFNKQLEVLTQSGTTLTFNDNHGITTQNLLIDTATGERRAVTAVSGNSVTVASAFSTTLTTVLSVQAEGLPNITGKILSSGGSNDQFLADSTSSYLTEEGALYLTSFRSTSSMANGSDDFKTPRGIGLDASKSNATPASSYQPPKI